jgi:FtsH-binding integral membrane protein
MEPQYQDRAHHGATQVDQVAYDEGLRGFMLKVYNYMTLALGITGAVAFGVASYAKSSPEFMNFMYVSPMKWVILLAPLAVIFFLSFRIQKMSAGAAQATFWFYAVLMGVWMSIIFMVFQLGSIAMVFAITAAMFGSMSLIGYTTKRDLTGMGSFLMMGVIGLIIAIVINMIWPSGALMFAISVIGVLIFAGLTAYDTQKIKQMYSEAWDNGTYTKAAIMGALSLYLDFINMFIFLLHLLGGRE